MKPPTEPRTAPPEGPDKGSTDSRARTLVALDDRAEADRVVRALEACGIPARAGHVDDRETAGDSSRVGVVLVEGSWFASTDGALSRLERAHGPFVHVVVLEPPAEPSRRRLPDRAHVSRRPLELDGLTSLVRAALHAHARALEGHELAVKLERAHASRDDFLSLLSHELRTPLTPIIGWTQILKRGPLEADKLRAGLEVIERNARQQAAVVGELLDLSRAQHGLLELELGEVDVRELARRFVAARREQGSTLGLELDSSGLEGAPLFVRGDPDRLGQVIDQLLGNALKFTPRGGEITVRALERDGKALVEVEDTGVGIERQLLEATFDVFWQADSGTKRRTNGLGVGLALAKHLVEAHGGTIAASSAGLGQGATFAVALPLVAGARRARSSNGASPVEHRPAGGHHVLVVEDDADTRVALGALLVHDGFAVTLAASGREGLEQAKAIQPALVLTDFAMPGMDGLELAREIRAHPQLASTPVVALTGQGRRLDAATARGLGFADYLSKPISAAALLGSIHRVLEEK